MSEANLLGGAPPCERLMSLYSRGPRSGPGYVVLAHHHLSTPSAPLAGTAQLHRSATYMCCLRCAGAPRRPASGSALYLLDPSQHVDLYVPGEPLAANIQFLHETRLPSRRTVRLGTPNLRRCRGLLVCHCYDLLSCSPPLRRLLLPGFQRVRSPSPLPDITTVATGRFHRRVFHPLDLQLASLHRFFILIQFFDRPAR